ncbi:choline dehydrogenase [Enteractinococcus helveticum]|uniref:Choline dehydrogenase n=2 Tax=Enteractinococcus helveticum TaxID=1837282 RepID=A0A1B7M390_9MICC|nr:choline dehydrogenase [Enteractinococcus helveticum]
MPFDYVVVGGGTAGAVVASRLTEDPKVSVLLLEAGPENNSYWSKVPLGFAKILFKPKYMWLDWKTQPDTSLGGKTYALPHGKVLGGSSSINGLVHVRGNPGDYNAWAEAGATGWDYHSVLSYFKKSEQDHRGQTEFHGGSGPFKVELARWKNPLADAFVEAAQQALGIARNEDFNRDQIEGAGYWDLATWNGVRSSTENTYLRNARKRPNLHIITEATVTKIGLEGKQATSVTYRRDGKLSTASARREIVLSAGALHTPQLLQVSGIGPGQRLQDLGIPVVHDLPGVGENLMDHAQYGVKFTTSSPDTFNKKVGNWFTQGFQGIKYYLLPRNGPINIGASLAGAFLKTDPKATEPDLQLHFLPFMPGEKGWDLANFSGFRLGMYQGRPLSRGHAHITSPSVDDSPDFIFNHLSHEADQQVAVAGMRAAMKIAANMPAKFNIKQLEPGLNINDNELLNYIKETTDTAFHFAGTTRMGSDDQAVVDPELRVHGIKGLRVVDASVMPSQITANINPAVLMIGERGADLIKADARNKY